MGLPKGHKDHAPPTINAAAALGAMVAVSGEQRKGKTWNGGQRGGALLDVIGHLVHLLRLLPDVQELS